MQACSRRIRRQTRKGVIALTGAMLAATLIFSSPTHAADTTAEQRVEVAKLARERNTVYIKLKQLDTKAADAIKKGEPAEAIHAQQISLQDKLDLLQLRLEMVAVRYGVDIPPMPSEQVIRNPQAQTTAVAKAQFQRGRDRAVTEVRRQTLELLASINFDAFLKQGS